MPTLHVWQLKGLESPCYKIRVQGTMRIRLQTIPIPIAYSVRFSGLEVQQQGFNKFWGLRLQGLKVYPAAPQQFLQGTTLQDSIHEHQKGATLEPQGRVWGFFGPNLFLITARGPRPRNTWAPQLLHSLQGLFFKSYYGCYYNVRSNP